MDAEIQGGGSPSGGVPTRNNDGSQCFWCKPMPYHFICPHCRSETLVEDEFSGQSGPCFSCGQAIALPDFAASLPHDPHAARRAVARSRYRQMALIVIGGLAMAMLGLAGLWFLGFPGVRAFQNAHDQRLCRRNLERIGQALQAYHDDHGTYPPAFLAGPDRKPMHSWRVLILPYLGERALYDRYDFTKSWDSEENAALVPLMPAVFACPTEDIQARYLGETNYVVLVGRNTVFPGTVPRGLDDIRDDPGNTILVTEMQAAGITWLQPRDLSASRIQFIINPGSEQEIGSYHPGGVYALMADGTVHFLANQVSEEYVRAMATRDGREEIPPNAME